MTAQEQAAVEMGKPRDEKTFAEAVRDGEVPGFTIDPDNPIFAYEWMPLDAQPGTKAIYTGHNGTDADQRYADKHLTAGENYTVRRIDVGGWSSKVELEERPGLAFNAVHFALRKVDQKS